jgi:hypothetical protein
MKTSDIRKQKTSFLPLNAHWVKLVFFTLMLLNLNVNSQPPQAVTYLRVVNPAASPVLTYAQDFTKNHIVLPNPEDDGFMMCMAAHVNTSVGFI